MTNKDIVDGADATIIAELDDAAEARIIDVLARVFTTNKYLDLKETICRAMDRYQSKVIEDAKRAVEKQYLAQQAAQQAAQRASAQNSLTTSAQDYLNYAMRKREAEYTTSLNPFDKPFWK